MKPILYDDTYEGLRWTYGLTLRPIAYGAVPDGFIVFSNRPHPDYPFGTLQYPFPITDRQREQMSLVLVDSPTRRDLENEL